MSLSVLTLTHFCVILVCKYFWSNCIFTEEKKSVACKWNHSFRMCQLLSGGENRKCALISQTAESWGRGCVRRGESRLMQQNPTRILVFNRCWTTCKATKCQLWYLHSHIYQVLFHVGDSDGPKGSKAEEREIERWRRHFHCRKNRVTSHYFFTHWPIFCFTHTLLPWSYSGTKIYTDTETVYIIFSRRGKYVMVNKMRQGWGETYSASLYKITAVRCWQPFWDRTTIYRAGQPCTGNADMEIITN